MSASREACPVCTGARTEPFEQRDRVPVMMNRLYGTREAARACKLGTLDLWRCGDCGFVWNRAFDPALLLYDEVYENDQTNSGVFAAHVAARAAEVIAAVPPSEPIDYLEVGCGQAVFIAKVEAMAGSRLRSAEGFDPAWRGEPEAQIGRARIHKAYLNHASVRMVRHAPNVVASRHTIEHVSDPVAFLSAIRKALGPASRATLFIETPCVDWIITNRAMHDLFYEHCSIFTAHALAIAFERAGFGAIDVSHVFEGQYLWGHGAAGAPAGAGRGEKMDQAVFDPRATADYVGGWRARVAAAAKEGAVAIWGGGAKGVTFSLLVDPEAGLIDHIIDINPAKQGKHVAGSGLQVLSPHESAGRRPRTIFVMNPNYMAEIFAMAAAAGLMARLTPVD